MNLATNIQIQEVWFLLHMSTSEDDWLILFWAVLSFSYPLIQNHSKSYSELFFPSHIPSFKISSKSFNQHSKSESVIFAAHVYLRRWLINPILSCSFLLISPLNSAGLWSYLFFPLSATQAENFVLTSFLRQKPWNHHFLRYFHSQ